MFLFFTTSKGLIFTKHLQVENNLNNITTFFTIQIAIVYFYVIVKTHEEKKISKENLLKEQSEKLGRDNSNIVFSRKKTSEISYSLHQFISNLEHSNEIFKSNLFSIRNNIDIQKVKQEDMLQRIENTIFLNDKIIKFLNDIQQENLSYLKNISKNDESSSSLMKKTDVIKSTNEQMYTEISTLIDSSATIGSLIELIRGISNQINLLSLNASIEASKAGESGKGISVVAKEIKHLQIDVLNTLESISKQLNNIEDSSQKIKNHNRQINNNIEEFSSLSNNNHHLISMINGFFNDFQERIKSISKEFTRNAFDVESVQTELHENKKIHEVINVNAEEILIQRTYQEKNMEEITNIVQELQEKLKSISKVNSRNN